MSSLSFICDYSSDSEDSESVIKISKPKLPVPDLSKVRVVPSEYHVDDPQLHGGRTRSFPHVRGNWATHVYVKFPKEEVILKLFEKLEQTLINQTDSWQRCADVHISLSKTFTLQFHLITPFTNSLQKIVCEEERFELEFDELKVYTNDDNTRTFIALGVDHYSQRHLLSLTEKIDELLDEYKLPLFYEDPSYHMSLFWINGDHKKVALNILQELQKVVDIEISHKTAIIEKVYCKSGNKYFQYYLQ